MSLQFDLILGKKLRSEGMGRVEARNARFMLEVRAGLRLLSSDRPVSVDDAREIAGRLGLEPSHKNAWGTVFGGPGWVKVGQEASSLVSNHAHKNLLWRFDPKPTGKA